MSDPQSIKEQILDLAREYSRVVHQSNLPASDSQKPSWSPGQPIPYAGRVFSDQEVAAAVSSTLDFWLTLGSEGSAMEAEFSSFFRNPSLFIS